MDSLPNEHEVLVSFVSREVHIESNPENYVPVFAAQDKTYSTLFIVDRPHNPLDDFYPPKVMGIGDGGNKVYYVIERKEGSRAIPEDAISFLQSQNMAEFYRKCIDDMSLFIGEDQGEMEQTKVIERRYSIPNISGIGLRFKSYLMDGTLIIPNHAKGISYPFVVEKGMRKKRPLESIAISRVSGQ